jgi:alkylation response protein AidB-like acyl-CoA dehydrogenase
MSVDLGLSPDQVAITELFDGFFGNEAPPTVARAAEPLGFDPGLWAKVIELGAPGMGSAIEHGGGGACLRDLVVVAESVGRSIAPIPLVDHLAALTVLADADLVAGDAIAAVSVRPADADGVWRLVPAGAVADLVLGVDGDELVAVRSEPPMTGPANHASAPIADRSARVGTRTVIGSASAFDAVLDRWKVLTAASLVGIADAAKDLGVAYVMEREQFGVPVGSFQAVQHGLADLPVLVDGGRLLTHKAAWAIDTVVDGVNDWRSNDITDGSTLATMALVFATDAAIVATDRSLHYHGGYGFAEEYDIQMYYRRARGWSLILDDPTNVCLSLADRLFGFVEA